MDVTSVWIIVEYLAHAQTVYTWLFSLPMPEGGDEATYNLDPKLFKKTKLKSTLLSKDIFNHLNKQCLLLTKPY